MQRHFQSWVAVVWSLDKFTRSILVLIMFMVLKGTVHRFYMEGGGGHGTVPRTGIWLILSDFHFFRSLWPLRSITSDRSNRVVTVTGGTIPIRDTIKSTVAATEIGQIKKKNA